MSDIVERLGDVHLDPPYPWHIMSYIDEIIAEAANEITRLRTENEQLKSEIATLVQQIRSERRVRNKAEREMSNDVLTIDDCEWGYQECHKCTDTECNDNMLK